MSTLKNPGAPVVLVVGDDAHLAQTALDDVIRDLKAAHPDLSLTLHEVDETEHLPTLRTESLFGGRTCVVLRGTHAASGALKDEIEEYLENPSGDATLVMSAVGTNHIRKVATLAGKVGERVDVKAPRDWARRDWENVVTAEFARRGATGDPGAVAAVLDRAGLDPAKIASAVGQVVAATGRDRVTAADVERVVEGVGSQGAFALADAVASRDLPRALELLSGSLGAGDDPLKVLGAVASRFRDLLRARSGGDLGRMPDRVKADLRRWAGAYGPGELSWCLDRLCRADSDLKGGSAHPGHLVAETLVVDLCTPRDVPWPWNPAGARP